MERNLALDKAVTVYLPALQLSCPPDDSYLNYINYLSKALFVLVRLGTRMCS